MIGTACFVGLSQGNVGVSSMNLIVQKGCECLKIHTANIGETS